MMFWKGFLVISCISVCFGYSIPATTLLEVIVDPATGRPPRYPEPDGSICMDTYAFDENGEKYADATLCVRVFPVDQCPADDLLATQKHLQDSESDIDARMMNPGFDPECRETREDILIKLMNNFYTPFQNPDFNEDPTQWMAEVSTTFARDGIWKSRQAPTFQQGHLPNVFNIASGLLVLKEIWNEGFWATDVSIGDISWDVFGQTAEFVTRVQIHSEILGEDVWIRYHQTHTFTTGCSNFPDNENLIAVGRADVFEDDVLLFTTATSSPDFTPIVLETICNVSTGIQPDAPGGPCRDNLWEDFDECIEVLSRKSGRCGHTESPYVGDTIYCRGAFAIPAMWNPSTFCSYLLEDSPDGCPTIEEAKSGETIQRPCLCLQFTSLVTASQQSNCRGETIQKSDNYALERCCEVLETDGGIWQHLECDGNGFVSTLYSDYKCKVPKHEQYEVQFDECMKLGEDYILVSEPINTDWPCEEPVVHGLLVDITAIFRTDYGAFAFDAWSSLQGLLTDDSHSNPLDFKMFGGSILPAYSNFNPYLTTGIFKSVTNGRGQLAGFLAEDLRVFSVYVDFGTGGYPDPSYPDNPSYPTQKPGYPSQEPAYPSQEPAYPSQEPAYPSQEPAYPSQEPYGEDSWCHNYCGGKSEYGCYCDDTCYQYGDCCADSCEECGYCDSIYMDEGYVYPERPTVSGLRMVYVLSGGALLVGVALVTIFLVKRKRSARVYRIVTAGTGRGGSETEGSTVVL